jgi:uncharacterized membrane protein YeaQ/YmgE (transglycosylase-associated protein family)
MGLPWFLIISLVAGGLAGMLVNGGGFGLIGDQVVRVWGNNRPIGEFRMLSTSARCRSTRLFKCAIATETKRAPGLNRS